LNILGKQWTVHRRTQDFTMEGVHVVGGVGVRIRDLGSVGSGGKAPVGGLGDEVPPEAEAKCEICEQFLMFSRIKSRI